MWHDCSMMRNVGALLFAGLWLCIGNHVVAQASESASRTSPIRVDIAITARQFKPSPVSLTSGRQVVLVFHNQDAELHAFVPKRFLENLPVHVDGNGATQFGATGLERVLIPSGGREEIHFVPEAVGTFEYHCDLPGHQMIGTIVVEEQPAHQQAVGPMSSTTHGQP